MLRAIRFAIIYDLKLDKKILNFIKNNKDLIKEISYYRKKEELDRIFSSKNKLKGLKFLKELEILDVLEIDYDDVLYTEDIYGIYAQIKFSDNYPLTKESKKIIKDIREVLTIKEINNYTLYKYGV